MSHYRPEYIHAVCNACLANFSYKKKDERRRKYPHTCTSCIRRHILKPNPNAKHLMSKYRHGGALNGKKTKTFRLWTTIKERIYNKNSKAYRYYGGKGLSLSEPWHDFAVFKKDIESYGYEEGDTLLRRDKSLGYSLENIRVVKGKVTGNLIHYRSSNYTYNELLAFATNGISREGLVKRIEKGMSVELALTKPLSRKRNAKEIERMKMNPQDSQIEIIKKILG